MQSYYEINVSKNGKYVFSTAERSATNIWEARKLYKLFKEKFPESEGYKIDVTYWECIGHKCQEEIVKED